MSSSGRVHPSEADGAAAATTAVTRVQLPIDELVEALAAKVGAMQANKAQFGARGQFDPVKAAAALRDGADELELKGCGLTSEDVPAIVSYLRCNQSLRSLKLQDNKIGDDGVVLLAGAIKSHPTLETLWLGSNPFGAIGMEALADGLVGSPVTWLVVRNNDKMGDAAARSLGRVLKDTRLATLVLISLGISDDGARALADGLAGSALQELNLSTNRLTDAGAEALVSGVRDSDSLATLVIRGNPCAEHGFSGESVLLMARFPGHASLGRAATAGAPASRLHRASEAADGLAPLLACAPDPAWRTAALLADFWRRAPTPTVELAVRMMGLTQARWPPTTTSHGLPCPPMISHDLA